MFFRMCWGGQSLIPRNLLYLSQPPPPHTHLKSNPGARLWTNSERLCPFLAIPQKRCASVVRSKGGRGPPGGMGVRESAAKGASMRTSFGARNPGHRSPAKGLVGTTLEL